MSISGKLITPTGSILSTNSGLQTVNKLLIKPFSTISIYRTQVVFLVEKFANASWDVKTWQYAPALPPLTKKSDAGTFSHHFLHNRSVVTTQGKRKEVAWTLRVGMSEVLTLLPLGSAAGEWAKTFKKILPYMYQFQESRDWRVIKRCLVTEKQYLVSGRNPFYCPSRMVMSYRPLLQLLITLAQACIHPT